MKNEDIQKGKTMLNSVINIYLLIGFIFPRGLTFFNPSATIISPLVKPEVISILLLVLHLHIHVL